MHFWHNGIDRGKRIYQRGSACTYDIVENDEQATVLFCIDRVLT